MWEKTVWTWTRGPQAVGFSLWHVYPGFAIFGGLSSYSLIIWLVPAGWYLFFRRRDVHPIDIGMFALALLVLLAMVTPDNFFA
jgi:hypothetical protein